MCKRYRVILQLYEFIEAVNSNEYIYFYLLDVIKLEITRSKIVIIHFDKLFLSRRETVEVKKRQGAVENQI